MTVLKRHKTSVSSTRHSSILRSERESRRSSEHNMATATTRYILLSAFVLSLARTDGRATGPRKTQKADQSLLARAVRRRQIRRAWLRSVSQMRRKKQKCSIWLQISRAGCGSSSRRRVKSSHLANFFGIGSERRRSRDRKEKTEIRAEENLK